MAEQTTLSVDPDLRDKIRARKVGGETYSDVIRRLMKNADSDQTHR
jgi:predicted CopG family antitoxin